MQVSTPMGTELLHLGEVPPSGTPSHREPPPSLLSPDTGYPPLNPMIYLHLLPGLPGKPARPQPHSYTSITPRAGSSDKWGRGPTLGPLLLKLKSPPKGGYDATIQLSKDEWVQGQPRP